MSRRFQQTKQSHSFRPPRKVRAKSRQHDRRSLRSLEQQLMPAPAHGGDVRVHLAYPNKYWVAMSNLGFQAVYSILARQPGVAIERAFYPEDDTSESDKAFRTFESEANLQDCDVLGFSLSFETDYPHVLRMLASQGLLEPDPLERNRQADAASFRFPLLLGGGTGVTLNPEPLADFFDVIFLGEAEEFLPELVTAVRESRAQGLTRRQTLEKLSALEGVYVPQLYQPYYDSAGALSRVDSDFPTAKRRFVKDISKYPTHSVVLSPETEFRSMFLTETGRGCEMGCRFCVAGYIYRPVRKRSEESIADSVKIGLEHTDAVGFVGAAVSSHRSIAKLTSSVAGQGARASLSSIMSQKVSRELAMSLSESEYKTVALAPEAGSDRLRRAAGKRVSSDQIVEAARTLSEAGIRGFKLYFMVGLPTEQDEDVEAILTLTEAVRDAVFEAARSSGKAPWIILSVNPFIPKAATPFQWEPMLGRRELEAKIKRLKFAIARLPNVDMNYESPRESYFQTYLSRGDRRVSRVLLHLQQNQLDWKWLVAHADDEIVAGVPTLNFYATRRIPFDEILPWEVVDSRIDRKLLIREARRAYEEVGQEKKKVSGVSLSPERLHSNQFSDMVGA